MQAIDLTINMARIEKSGQQWQWALTTDQEPIGTTNDEKSPAGDVSWAEEMMGSVLDMFSSSASGISKWKSPADG